MIEFWLIAATMLLVALLFIILPLIRKPKIYLSKGREQTNVAIFKQQLTELSQELQQKKITEQQFKNAKLELQTTLLQNVDSEESQQLITMPSWKTVIVLMLAVPVIAILLYMKLGDSQQVKVYLAQQKMPKLTKEQIAALGSPQQIADKLRSKLQGSTDPRGWALLGKLDFDLANYQQASFDYQQAHKYKPDDLQITFLYAQTLFFANNNRLNDKAQQLLQQVLKLQPHNIAVINLQALNAYTNKDYQAAINYWEKLLLRFPEGSQDQQAVLNAIAKARKMMGDQQLPSSSHIKLTVTVSLAAQQQTKLNPADTVFVFAKRTTGMSMPVAAVKLQVKDLPKTIILDDSKAMMATNQLSSAKQVIVTAKVVEDGNALSAKALSTVSSKALKLNQSNTSVDLVLG